MSDENVGEIKTKCYTKSEDEFGWCATCNMNSTQPTDPNYCDFNEEEGGTKTTKVVVSVCCQIWQFVAIWATF